MVHLKIEEEVNQYQSEGIPFINRGVRKCSDKESKGLNRTLRTTNIKRMMIGATTVDG